MTGWRQNLILKYGLTEKQIAAFEELLELMLDRKDRGLTAVTRPENIIRVHFLDSLSLLDIPEFPRAGAAADIGSGAGFPGLPLAIALPHLHMSLIESNRKKSAFIDDAVKKLKLENAVVLSARAEEVARGGARESFVAAVARAVGSLPEVIEYALPLLGTGGFAFLQRGAREAGDAEIASRVATELGGRLVRIEKSSPYPAARNLHIWILEKTSPTPVKYPRRPGMARKRPIGP